MKKPTFLMAVLAVLCLAATSFAQTERPDRPGGRRGGPPEGRPQPGQMMRNLPLMIALDANQDGELSKREIDNAAKALRKLDKNNDGVIDASELRPERPDASEQVAGMIERMMENDKDGDGKLSEDELPERMQRGFARMDQNEDGFLDKKEIEAIASRMGRGGPGGRGGEGGAGGRGGRGGGAGGRGGDGEPGRGGRGGRGGDGGGDNQLR